MLRFRGPFMVGAALLPVALVAAYLLDLTPTRDEVTEVVSAAQAAVAPRVDDPAPVPRWRHVYVVMLENRNPEEIVGAPDAPYLNSLIARGAVATNMWAAASASQPNYFALTSGSTHFVTDNDTVDIDAPSIFDQLEAHGRDWLVHAENVPDGCFTGDDAGGSEGPGRYVRAHEPAISYTAIRTSPQRCARIGDLGTLARRAATFQLIVPASCHNTHDCPVASGDTFLSRILPPIVDGPRFMDDSLLVVAFDGGSDTGPNDRHDFATILVGAGVRPGTVSDERYSHYNILRTIQEGLGLDCLDRSCSADTMADLFGPGPRRAGL